MRKISLQFTVYSLLVTLFLGCAQREVKNIDSLGKNIICFGDSLTTGEGAEPGNDYPSILAKQISLPVINAGESGDTTYNALKRLQVDVLEKRPLVVIIVLGGNDFLKKIPLEETFKNLEIIVKMIQDAGAITVLAELHSGIILSGYSKGYRRIARKHKAVLIPELLDGIINKPILKSDYIHPNTAGYKIMAERITKAIQPIIQLNLRKRKNAEGGS